MTGHVTPKQNRFRLLRCCQTPLGRGFETCIDVRAKLGDALCNLVVLPTPLNGYWWIALSLQWGLPQEIHDRHRFYTFTYYSVAYDWGELCMDSDLGEPIRGCGDGFNQECSESCVLFIVHEEPVFEMFSGDEPQGEQDFLWHSFRYAWRSHRC